MFSKMGSKAQGKEQDDESYAFFNAITDELSEKFESGKIEEAGLSLKAHSIVYGYKLMPVMRMSISDKDKIMELIKRAEDESDHKVEFDKCGEFECMKSKGKRKGDPSVAIVLLKNQVAMSVFSPDKEKEIIEHLIGNAEPKKSYSEDKWDAFLKENGYTGFGDGFVNLKQLYDTNKADIIAGLFMPRKSVEMSDEEKQACSGVVDDHIKNMPEIVFGTKNMEEKSMDVEMVFKTSKDVSDVLQTLANDSNIAQRSVNPIFDMGFNFDIKKLSAAATTYSKFLIASAKEHKCTSIKEKDIRKGMGGFLMVSNMGLSQFKSIYVSLNDLEMNDKMQPQKIDAMLSIGSDDPASLLAMAGMMAPPLAQLKIPEDGTAVKLPAGAIPSKGMPVPPLSISRSDKSINIMMGNDKPELKDYKSEKNSLMSFALDGKRYYGIMAKMMKNLPAGKGAKELKVSGVAELMEGMGDMTGQVQQEITADKRGLVIDYYIQY
jgi:hypothetical protein